MIKFITLSVIILGFLWGKSMPITIGDPAPDFSLPDENGQMHSLSQYRGQKVVVYFYPKDNTPGCTKEACGIRDTYSLFENDNIVVFGISYDNAASVYALWPLHRLPNCHRRKPKKRGLFCNCSTI